MFNVSTVDEVFPTICECVEGFASDVQGSQGWALGLSGPPAGQCSLQGWGPVTDHPQGLPLHWDDLTALRLRGVGVWLGHWTTGQGGRWKKTVTRSDKESCNPAVTLQITLSTVTGRPFISCGAECPGKLGRCVDSEQACLQAVQPLCVNYVIKGKIPNKTITTTATTGSFSKKCLEINFGVDEELFSDVISIY